MASISIINQYFPNLTEQQTKLLLNYQTQLIEINRSINLISRKDVENIEIRHILHSLAIAKVHRFKPATTAVDIGTGGGLPGIPLAILFPKTKFVLVDTIEKKTKAVQQIVENLNLPNVKVLHARAEKVKTKFNYVLSRAVTQLPKLLSWSKILLEQSNDHKIIMLKGGDINKETKDLNYQFEIKPINDFFKEDFFKEKYVISTEL